MPNGDSAVSVKIVPGTSRLIDIFDALSSQTPGGYAPTAEALRQALNYYVSGEGHCVPGSRWVMLVTAGAGDCNPSLTCGADTCTENQYGSCSSDASCCDGTGYLCADDAAVVDALGQLASAGILTFVVAPTPSSALDRASLNAYANAGKMPNPNGGDAFYNIADTLVSSDLVSAIETITPQLVKTCDIKLAPTPTSSSDIRVFADCQEIYQSSPDAGAGGWFIDFSQSPAHLKFLGSTCQNILSNGVQQLDVLYECGPNML